MQFFTQKSNTERGFTLNELLVTIGIIGVLTAIMTTSLTGARGNARDKARVADLATMQQAARLYAEENGAWPSHDDGIGVGIGDAIDTQLATYFTSVPKDPLSGSGSYNYWYDSSWDCDGTSHVVLMALETESGGIGNYESICESFPAGGGTDDVVPGSNPYIILID